MERPRFEIRDCPLQDVDRLERELQVSNPLAQVLVRRGLGEPARARTFLAAEEEHPPAAFVGIEQAIEPILRHARNGERITIHGDYDVDGVCSTAVLVRSLRRLGADVDWYLPDRATDGYGLNAETVKRLCERGTRLLVTVDCAITAVDEVALALALGMEVVVTDHHARRADGVLPQAPIVHPAICDYPCPELCATGVAYKLAQALESAAAGPGAAPEGRALEEDLDLVALATIADLVPLVGENRTLVRRGMRALVGTAKPGLRALMAVARVDPSKLNERSVGFALGRGLNAAGRLYRADAGLELILTEDPMRAAQIAEELDRANYERRRTETRIRYEAEAQIAALDPANPPAAYVLAGEDWHAGVIGIVASRLVESHRRPVVLIAMAGDLGKGSGRSIDAFDLLAGLTACGGHLRGYGGHRAAAGLEIEREQVQEFTKALCAHAGRVLEPADMVPVERVDAVVGGEQLGMELAEELQALAPFGKGNPGVALLLAGATFSDVRPMGNGKHARFTVQSGGARSRGVAFGTGGGLPVAEGEIADVTFKLEVNEWNGVTEPRLVFRHVRSSEPQSTAPPAVEDEELVLFAMS